MISWLLRIVLFDFHVFAFFTSPLPQIEFYFHSIAEIKDAWKKFNFLKLIAVWFVTQDVSYPEECPIALEKKMYSVTFGRNVLKYQLSLFGVGMLMCAQSYKTVLDPRECSLPILQARILEWVAVSSFRESSQARVWTLIFCISKQILYHLSHLDNYVM